MTVSKNQQTSDVGELPYWLVSPIVTHPSPGTSFLSVSWDMVNRPSRSGSRTKGNRIYREAARPQTALVYYNPDNDSAQVIAASDSIDELSQLYWWMLKQVGEYTVFDGRKYRLMWDHRELVSQGGNAWLHFITPDSIKEVTSQGSA